MENLIIKKADLENSGEAQDVLLLLRHYAIDLMGGGQDLSEDVRNNLIPALSKRMDALIFIAYYKGEAAGLAISFEGFSTFYAKPLINIHDFVVKDTFRGKGIARKMLEAIEAAARERNCCKLTLEVLEGNARARKVYQDFGFASYQLDPTAGRALFLDKKI